jgi:hypothetical protein
VRGNQVESRDDHRKALAAFLLFPKAPEAEQVSLRLLQDLASSVEEARRGIERRLSESRAIWENFSVLEPI